VVLQTLTAHFPGSAGERRISVAGPAIRLSPNAAVSLNMAFHELVTNAVKYGALSNRHGVVTVTWAVNAATHPAVVEILWVENGGPPVAPPSHRGFGSRLIERGLSRELDGEISLIFDPAGVLCRLDLPVSSKLELLA
jgi:two-component sensor histidine kinase